MPRPCGNPHQRGFGVEVILNAENPIESNPHCPHGPTLIFERYTADGKKTGRRFFACSACRDRKDCSFFQWVDQQNDQQEDCPKPQKLQRKKQLMRLKAFRQLPLHRRRFCTTCSLLLLPEEWKQHDNHHYVNIVKKKQVAFPSTLLEPLQNSKKEAQYLFSEKTVTFIVSCILKDLHATKVICIGAPRIHECICAQKELGITSLLLDIDSRYCQFYGPRKFLWYNMFNHHFFEGKRGERIFNEFISAASSDLVVIMDPPFGGLIEVLSHTLKRISCTWMEKCGKQEKQDQDEIVPVLWFFPYFNEAKLLQYMPSLKMLDYKVDYDNHPLFHGGEKGRKQGSPVRIFTNISPQLFKLPKQEGYRFCELCERYVSRENKHCDKCKACTSKDGRPYHHCDLCGRCVKSSYEHCDMCSMCVLKEHECSTEIMLPRCHCCKGIGHKRKDCPNKSSTNSRKRMKKK